MIWIAEYTDKLDRFALQGKGETADELERVAAEVIGVTFDDLFNDDVVRITKTIRSAADAIVRCRRLGYDLSISGNVPVICWKDMAVLIIAKGEGIIPTDPSARDARRLAIASGGQQVHDEDDFDDVDFEELPPA